MPEGRAGQARAAQNIRAQMLPLGHLQQQPTDRVTASLSLPSADSTRPLLLPPTAG